MNEWMNEWMNADKLTASDWRGRKRQKNSRNRKLEKGDTGWADEEHHVWDDSVGEEAGKAAYEQAIQIEMEWEEKNGIESNRKEQKK